MLYWLVSCVRHCYRSPLNLRSNQQDFCCHGLWQLPSLYLAESRSGSASSRELIVNSVCPIPRLPKRRSYCFLDVLKRMCFPSRVSVAPWSLGSELIASSLCLTTPPGGESRLCSGDRFRRQWPEPVNARTVNASCRKLSFLQHELYSLLSCCRGDRLSIIPRLATR